MLLRIKKGITHKKPIADILIARDIKPRMDEAEILFKKGREK